MQESSCKADTVGGAGEQGLMQITKDKCGGAPGGNCMDPVSGVLCYNPVAFVFIVVSASNITSEPRPATLLTR